MVGTYDLKQYVGKFDKKYSLVNYCDFIELYLLDIVESNITEEILALVIWEKSKEKVFKKNFNNGNLTQNIHTTI